MKTVTAIFVPQDASQPLKSILVPQDPKEDLEQLTSSIQEPETSIDDVRQRLLLRPSPDGEAGMYAFAVIPAARQRLSTKNIRATRVAMACGCFSYQLYGNVVLVRTSLASREDLQLDDVSGACCISPDLRARLQQEIQASSEDKCQSSTTCPSWLGNALQQNYHDVVVLSRLAAVMTESVDEGDDNDDSYKSDSDDRNSTNSSHHETISLVTGQIPTEPSKSSSAEPLPPQQFVTKQTLCMNCRRPASTLCEGCQACYFCDPPRNCKAMGWTHECLCPTWKAYESRRGELATFSYLGNWTKDLSTAAFHSSEQPYEFYLRDQLGINMADADEIVSWWSTELHGWAGGNSESAKTVDISIRQSYAQGFAPLTDIPPQRNINASDIVRATQDGSAVIEKNAVGLWRLQSWEDYYQLRNLPPSSPVALLCTFPLTVYHGIVCYGEVPCTVARMLKRPLRIHIVGVEKEANFLDLFQEIGFLLPDDFPVEITFIVREDMIPPKCRQPQQNNTGKNTTRTASIMMQLQLCPNLSIAVVSGTYGDSLDPNFDCGTAGPPDMVMGLNAGLYAYETWRSVVTYLHHNPGVVGVFTDYNEYSGVNCASLAGHNGRESLRMNPFRQPLAMPVYSMNLPQFSNGFFYVMNAQELE